jgi:hypothetical protein
MSNDGLKDLLDVPADDAAKGYGAGSHAVDAAGLGDGFSAGDDTPGRDFDTPELAETYLPGQAFTTKAGKRKGRP